MTDKQRFQRGCPLFPKKWISPSQWSGSVNSMEEERVFRCRGCDYIETWFGHLGLQTKTNLLASAFYYLQLFYMYNDVDSEDLGIVSIACVFLTCKLAETQKKMREIVTAYKTEIMKNAKVARHSSNSMNGNALNAKNFMHDTNAMGSTPSTTGRHSGKNAFLGRTGSTKLPAYATLNEAETALFREQVHKIEYFLLRLTGFHLELPVMTGRYMIDLYVARMKRVFIEKRFVFVYRFQVEKEEVDPAEDVNRVPDERVGYMATNHQRNPNAESQRSLKPENCPGFDQRLHEINNQVSAASPSSSHDVPSKKRRRSQVYFNSIQDVKDDSTNHVKDDSSKEEPYSNLFRTTSPGTSSVAEDSYGDVDVDDIHFDGPVGDDGDDRRDSPSERPGCQAPGTDTQRQQPRVREVVKNIVSAIRLYTEVPTGNNLSDASVTWDAERPDYAKVCRLQSADRSSDDGVNDCQLSDSDSHDWSDSDSDSHSCSDEFSNSYSSSQPSSYSSGDDSVSSSRSLSAEDSSLQDSPIAKRRRIDDAGRYRQTDEYINGINGGDPNGQKQRASTGPSGGKQTTSVNADEAKSVKADVTQYTHNESRQKCGAAAVRSREVKRRVSLGSKNTIGEETDHLPYTDREELFERNEKYGIDLPLNATMSALISYLCSENGSRNGSRASNAKTNQQRYNENRVPGYVDSLYGISAEHEAWLSRELMTDVVNTARNFFADACRTCVIVQYPPFKVAVASLFLSFVYQSQRSPAFNQKLQALHESVQSVRQKSAVKKQNREEKEMAPGPKTKEVARPSRTERVMQRINSSMSSLRERRNGKSLKDVDLSAEKEVEPGAESEIPATHEIAYEILCFLEPCITRQEIRDIFKEIILVVKAHESVSKTKCISKPIYMLHPQG